MDELAREFASGDALIEYVAALSPWLDSRSASPIRGGEASAWKTTCG